MTTEGNEPVNTEVQATETQQVTTPTAEDRVKELEAQIAAKEQDIAKAKHFEEGYKGLQTQLNKLNTQLKSAQDVRSELDAQKQYIKVLAAAIAEKGNLREEDVVNPSPERKQNLLAQYEELEKQQNAKRQQAEAAAKAEEYNTKANEIYEKAKVVFKDNPDELERVEDRLSQGFLNPSKFERAVAMVEKAEKPVVVKESEEERINKLVEEKLKERLAEASKNNPLLKTEPAVPSGKGLSKATLNQQYVSGDITTEEYAKRKRELGF